MPPRKKRAVKKATVEPTQLPDSGENKPENSYEYRKAQKETNQNHNDNANVEVVNEDGKWYWKRGDRKSQVGYNNPVIARMMAPHDTEV